MQSKISLVSVLLGAGLITCVAYLASAESRRQVEGILDPSSLGDEATSSLRSGSLGLSLPQNEPDSAIRLDAGDEVLDHRREANRIVSSSKQIVIAGVEFTEAWTGDIRSLYWADSGLLLSEGRWLDGKRTGLHRTWQKTGWLADEVNWVDGLRDGEAVYFSSELPNALVAHGWYKAGYKTGEWIRWYHTGELRSTGMYVFSERARSAVKQGDWSCYMLDGSSNEVSSGFYIDDTKID